MLGSEVERLLRLRQISYVASDADIDICSFERLKEFAAGSKIEWIVNCAAYTNVDKAEEERKEAFRINCDGVKNIALLAKNLAARLIHISTDYVFSGNAADGYCETDKTKPINIYGESKLCGEKEIAGLISNYFIIRTAWLYGRNGRNFVSTMLKLFSERSEVRVVSDQFGSPTNASNLAGAILNILASDSGKYGVYHYTDDGKIRWDQFAAEILHDALDLGIIKNKVKITPIKTEEYPLKAKRPVNSYLLKDKIKKELGIEPVDWKKSLRNFMEGLTAP